MSRASRAFVLLAAAASLQAAAALLQPFDVPGDRVPAPWRVALLPKQTLPATRFAVVEVDGVTALRVEARASYGNLVHTLDGGAGMTLAWRWRIDELLADADLRTREGDDTSLKVCAFFGQPLSDIPFVERQKLRLARLVGGETLPAATLCYVWDTRLPEGSVLANAYTPRVRYLVLRSGTRHLGEWRSERRELGADFLRAFGDESMRVPPLLGIGVGADADNTRGRSLGYVADLVLAP